MPMESMREQERKTSINLSWDLWDIDYKEVEYLLFFSGCCLWPCILVAVFVCFCSRISIFIRWGLCGHCRFISVLPKSHLSVVVWSILWLLPWSFSSVDNISEPLFYICVHSQCAIVSIRCFTKAVVSTELFKPNIKLTHSHPLVLLCFRVDFCHFVSCKTNRKCVWECGPVSLPSAQISEERYCSTKKPRYILTNSVLRCYNCIEIHIKSWKQTR